MKESELLAIVAAIVYSKKSPPESCNIYDIHDAVTTAIKIIEVAERGKVEK